MKPLDVEVLYQKYPELNKEDVGRIQEWLKKQPHLPKISDLHVAIFLHTAYFSVEATKIRIDSFYTCRTKIKSIFSQRDIAGEDMAGHRDVVAHVPLPQLTPEGYLVLFIKVLDSEKFNVKTYLKQCNFVFEVDMLEKGPVEGIVFVVDMVGSKLSHLAQANIAEVKHILYYMQHAFPGRIIHVNFINPVPFMSQVVALLKAFLSQELKEQLRVHENYDDIQQYVPVEVLPSDYKGGKAAPLKELNENTYKKLLENRDYFLEEEKMRVNEDLRPAKSNGLDDIFGLDGNFKKLDID